MVRSGWRDRIQEYSTELFEARGELDSAEARMESSDETVRDFRATMELETEELRSVEDGLKLSEAVVEDLQGEFVEYREMSDAHGILKRRLDLVEGRLAHNEWVASRAV